MHIHVRLRRQFVIEYRVDIIHIQTAGSDIRRNQYAGAAIRKAHQHLISLRLVEITVQCNGGNSLGLQVSRHLGAIDLGITENEIEAAAPSSQHANQFDTAILTRYRTPRLRYLRRLFVICDIDYLWLVLNTRADIRYRLRVCRAEQ